MKIVFSDKATAYDSKSGAEITSPTRLKKLDGLAYSEDRCDEYIDGQLFDAGVEGGIVKLKYDKAANQLMVVTEYTSASKLSKSFVKLLQRETEGQWTDGIGEGDFKYAQKLKMHVSLGGGGKSRTKVETFEAAPVRKKKPSKSALIKPLEFRKYDEATKLIDQGAEVNCKNRFGKTALHLAIFGQQFDMAAKLIDLGADVNAKCDLQKNAMHYLASCELPRPKMKQTVPIARKLVEFGANADETDEREETPLYAAVDRGNIELVNFLLDQSARINHRARGNSLMTPIMQCTSIDMATLLLSRGADPRIKTDYDCNAADYLLMNTHIRGIRKVAALLQECIDNPNKLVKTSQLKKKK